jgi:hypothetical protein
MALAALGLAGFATTAGAADATTATNAPAPAAQPYGKKPKENFFRRFNEAFMEQSGTAVFTPPDTNAPAGPVRRIGPPPFDGPPYPTQEWQLGGGPNVIGDPGALRDSPYPLMQAIYDGPHGQAWYDSRIQIYGWETVGGNMSTSHNTTGSPGMSPQNIPANNNYPEVYDERSDRLEQDQFVVYVERMADENQVDHIDWGFRYSFVYGLDYRFMITRGFLSDQLLVRNQYAGIDMPMMYGNIYIPQVAQGMNIIVGRIISLPDIEQQLAPNNLMASHSIVYGFDNYTMWGIWTTTKINANWSVQAGLADGVDMAPWQNDVGRQPTGSLLLQYIAPGGHDEIYGGMNSLNNGHFGYNNLQESILSYTHKFNEEWWTCFEAQYMYMKDCTTAPTYEVPVQDGFFPTHNGFVWEGGVVNYTMHRIAPNAFLTFRNEVYDDSGGARTGYATCYEESSVGVTWWPNKLMCIRPELRYEHSFSEKAYDNGSRHNQVTLAADLTYHF